MRKRTNKKSGHMKKTTIYQSTPEQLKPHPENAPPLPKRDNTFSQARDVREDRGTRQMKTTHNSQTFHRRTNPGNS
jgi:hypothetical protein